MKEIDCMAAMNKLDPQRARSLLDKNNIRYMVNPEDSSDIRINRQDYIDRTKEFCDLMEVMDVDVTFGIPDSPQACAAPNTRAVKGIYA